MDAKKSLATVGVAALASLFTDTVAAEGAYGAVSGGANYLREQRATQFDDGPLTGVSLGYERRNGFRPELELTFRENETESGFAGGSGEAASVMFNHWIDLPLSHRWRPYFGVGGGRANLERVAGNGVATGDEATVWAYQGGAGIGYYFTPRVALSVGWRYFATEHPEFDSGERLARYRADAALAQLRIGFGRERVRLVENPVPPQTAAATPAAPAVPAETAAFETVVLRAVNFEFDRAELTEPARQSLDLLVQRLQKTPDLRVTVEGHADAIGSNDYNHALSERRALAVVSYLQAQGVSRANLEVRALGENQPVTSNDTVEGRAANRRAAFHAPEDTAGVKIQIEPPTPDSIEAAKSGDPGLKPKDEGEAAAMEETPAADTEPSARDPEAPADEPAR